MSESTDLEAYYLKPWPADHVAVLCCKPDDPFWEDFGDSVDRNCYNCEEIVKVRPSTLAHANAEKAEYLCVQCHAVYAEWRGTPTRLLPPTPAAIKERGDGLHVASRKEFIESYVKVKAIIEPDTPELRDLAGKVYDILQDDSPEGNEAFKKSIAQVCDNVMKK